MQQRYNLAHFLLAIVFMLGLTSLMVCVDAQAQIAFLSRRAGNGEIYVMDADGGINKDSLKIAVMTFSLHGPPTANGLSSRLIGIDPRL